MGRTRKTWDGPAAFGTDPQHLGRIRTTRDGFPPRATRPQIAHTSTSLIRFLFLIHIKPNLQLECN